MGLDVNGTQFILYARALGVDFSRTAMIGRQGMHLSPADLAVNLRKFGYSPKAGALERMAGENVHAEDFLRVVGAQEVHSVDNSDYEGATHVHDMNQPIPDGFKQQYSVVLDGGSLEHIFDFPTAMKNCMEMVRVGGHFLGIAPANNFMGHGFYQFSPELFFRVFQPSNGYELERLLAFEDLPDAPWYRVQSPDTVHDRVTLTNRRPVYLLVVARRVAAAEPFPSPPQQSDYAAIWDQRGREANAPPAPGGQSGTTSRGLLGGLLRHTPYAVKRLVKRLVGFGQPRTGFDPRYFTPQDRLADRLVSRPDT